jgi:nitric oxide dioxygenase
MLNQTQIDIIKTTAPVVAAHAEEITRTFYPIMFTRYPEVTAVFNQAHQAGGGQPRALADAIIAYASNIDDLSRLGATVERIINKHVSLNITPPQYKIVGECLMAAIAEVLGAAITPDVAEAWGAAYWQLAELLIEAEENVYQAHERAPGGWRGARPVRIARKVRESNIITSFYLEPTDGRPLMAYKPGQYLGLKLCVDGQTLHRNYSLSASPSTRTYRISVKREPGGVASNWLHDAAGEGDLIDIYPPAGDFTLRDADAPVVLLTAGVGQTPAISMLEAAVAKGRPVTYLHFAQNGEAHAFREHVDGLAAANDNVKKVYVYDQPLPGDAPDHRGLVSADLLKAYLPSGAPDVYFLGPKPFMSRVFRDLKSLGVAEENIHFEFFGPLEALE